MILHKNSGILNYIIDAIDIGFVGIISFILAMIFSDITDNIFIERDVSIQNEKNFIKILFDTFLLTWFISIVIYLNAILIRNIPLPFNFLFDSRTPNKYIIYNLHLFTILYLLFQTHFKEKVKYVYYKLFQYITGKSRKNAFKRLKKIQKLTTITKE